MIHCLLQLQQAWGILNTMVNNTGEAEGTETENVEDETNIIIFDSKKI